MNRFGVPDDLLLLAMSVGLVFGLLLFLFALWAVVSVVRSQRRIALALEKLNEKSNSGAERNRSEIDREWKLDEPSSS